MGTLTFFPDFPLTMCSDSNMIDKEILNSIRKFHNHAQ